MSSRVLTPARVVLLIVLLGLALRSYHLLRGRAVWHDEAVVLVNVLDRDFTDLLGALRFHEAAPPLFLWAVKAASLLLGDSPAALRLVPFLTSCAALLLLVPVARHVLTPRAVPWALLLFACSEQMHWHASESKPYAVDVLVAAGVLALWTRVREERLIRALLAFAALAPVAIFSSYPACFVLGGVLVALLPAVWRRRSPGVLAGYALFGLVTVVSFVVLLKGPVKAQHDAVIHNDWVNCMPDFSRPWAVPLWTVASTFEVFRYCAKPLGQLLLPVAVLGGWQLWRGGRHGLVTLLVVPVALALVAAFLHRYPYGGVRVLAYAAPAVCLLVAAGTPAFLDRLRAVGRPAWALGCLVLLMPAAVAAQRVVALWPEADVPGAVRCVLAERRDGDVVTGNCWTHIYYLRGLGRVFYFEDEPEQATAGDRVWVLWTEEGVDHARRLVGTATRAPTGWRRVEDREFRFTSVALYVRDAGAGNASQPVAAGPLLPHNHHLWLNPPSPAP